MDDRRWRESGEEAVRSRLFEEDETLGTLLASADTVEDARDALLSYLSDLESVLHEGALHIGRLAWAQGIEAAGVFRSLLSPRNEATAGFSTLEVLWRLARGEREEELSAGFAEEFVHLIRAMHGRSGVEHGWLGAGEAEPEEEFERFPPSGRRAGLARSANLDTLAQAAGRSIARHRSGLDEAMVRQRTENAEKILAHFGARQQDWEDAAWQQQHVLKGVNGVQDLERLVPLTGEDVAAVHWALRYGLPWGITPYYLSLFDFGSSRRVQDGQVRAQVIPPIHTVRSMIEHRHDRVRALDFMRERDTSPIDRVTRRYPAIAILKVCDTCPQVCTYCQRNWELSDAMDVARIPDEAAFDPALAWFEHHPAIVDVLLTGGDALMLSDACLAYILERLAAMDHVRHIRIGTRMPVTLPMRITPELARLLGSFVEPGRRNLSVVTHVESAYEVTPDLVTAVDRLRSARISVYNQQVYTLYVSRRFEAVAARIALKRAGIDPYYTFYTKGKDEHRDYLVPVARILQERKEEARLLPGLFRTDEPVFNVPGLGKCHLRAGQDRELIAIRPDGRRVYLFHPWEKGIAAVEPWAYADVSIHDYLQRLEALGEDPDDYESIWYYY